MMRKDELIALNTCMKSHSADQHFCLRHFPLSKKVQSMLSYIFVQRCTATSMTDCNIWTIGLSV